MLAARRGIECLKLCHQELFTCTKLLTATKMSPQSFRGYCEGTDFGVKERMERLKTAGRELYPSSFKVSDSVRHVITKYQDLQPAQVSTEQVSLAGMITSVRESGKKIKFVDLVSDGESIQLKVHANNFESTQLFHSQTNLLRRGDKIGVVGKPCRTKSGELSVDCTKVELLAPSLRILPNKLESGQKKLRRRYLDILTNPKLRISLATRAKIIKHFRTFFEDLGFMEVETPILSTNVGGAAATPFITHHNEMKTNLYLRVAPELYLKQLVIAGFDRVFEIGKLFRNEGVDPSHNPEFTSCEFYMAYATYEDLMVITNKLFSSIVKELELDPRHNDGGQLDFISDYQTIEFLPSLSGALNTELPDPADLHQHDSLKFLVDECKKIGLSVPSPVTVPRVLDKLFSRLIEPHLLQPTFVTKQPMVMSPLAKPDPENPGLAQRFELFAAGLEVCNAYTELNDPQIQRATLAAQADMSDPEAMLPDEDFCVALEYGLPPTAGWGCGIDRLTAILTNNPNIKDTITFPLSKSSL